MTGSTPKDLVRLYESGQLAAEMAHRLGLTARDKISLVQAECARLHNTGAIDFLRLVEDGHLQALNGTSFFSAMHFFCKILPDLQASCQRMMACVEALVERGGTDGAANLPNAALREWCASDMARSREILAAARTGDALAGRHLTFALEALSDVPEARRILDEGDARLCLSAITALGRMSDKDPASRTETARALSRVLDRGADDNLKASLLSALTFVMTQNGCTPDGHAVDLMCRLLDDPGPFVVYQAAYVLWAYPQVHQPELVQVLLEALRHLNPANKGTISQLDHALTALLRSGHGEAAIDFVTALFERPGEMELTELEGFLRALVDGPAQLLGKTVVSWLRNGSVRLCKGLAEELWGQRDDQPVLELQDALKDLPPPAQLFVCRKAIGFFFIRERSAASVLVSALRVCHDAAVADAIQDHLQWLLLNYGSIRQYLSGVADDDPARARVTAALAANQTYLDGLNGVPELKEFQPSEQQRRIEHLRWADQMRAANKQAESKSVLLSMVKRSVLLYGSRSLSLIRRENDQLHPMETELKPYSASFELPRLEVYDPIGLDYTLRRYRVERMAP